METTSMQIARHIFETVRREYGDGATLIIRDGSDEEPDIVAIDASDDTLIGALRASDYLEVSIVDGAYEDQGTMVLIWERGQPGICEVLSNWTSDCVIAETILDSCPCKYCA